MSKPKKVLAALRHKQIILIAEKVMGWKVKRSAKTGWGSCGLNGVDFVDLQDGNQIILGPGESFWDPFANLDHAMQVLDVIRDKDEDADFRLQAHGGKRKARSSHGDWIAALCRNYYTSPLCKTRAEATALVAYEYAKDL